MVAKVDMPVERKPGDALRGVYRAFHPLSTHPVPSVLSVVPFLPSTPSVELHSNLLAEGAQAGVEGGGTPVYHKEAANGGK